MTVRSTVLGSESDGRGRGFFGDLRDRYFFSESCVTIAGGDQMTSSA